MLNNTREFVSPKKKGIIKDWALMEQLWDHAFHDALQVEPSNHPVLMSDIPIGPRPNRVKMAEIMFEKYNVPALIIALDSLLALISSGKSTGIVINIGEQVTSVVPFMEGYLINHAIESMDLGGEDITTRLMKLLGKKGYALDRPGDRAIARDIKEKLCYVSKDYDKEINLGEDQEGKIESEYTTPDLTTIILGNERFRAAECLFKPELVKKEWPPLDDLVISLVNRCEIDIHSLLFGNIILVGGSSLLPGLKSRLERQLQSKVPEFFEIGGKKYPSRIEVKIFTPPQRIHSVWLGGSMLTMLKQLKGFWVTPAQFKEDPLLALYGKGALD